MTDLPEIPESLRTLMASIGPRWARNIRGHIDSMIAEYSKVLAHSPKDGVAVERDVVYGANPRQKLDVFRPTRNQSAARPSVIFLHGGAFVEGDRNRTEEIYSNVLYYFARHGIVGINMGYRLAADAPYPGAVQDIASVVRWVAAHAADLEVSTDRLFLMGHSAGGAHVGTYAYRPEFQAKEGRIAGVIVVSGRVRIDNLPENPNARRVEAYYGPDASIYDGVSPVSLVGPDSPPTFIAFAEYDNPLLDIYALELAYRLAHAKRRAPPVIRLAGHNHTSIIGHFNTAEDVLGRAILAFIRSTN